MDYDENEPDELDAPIFTEASHHGWTPFSRRLFLEVLAETGRVSTACEYTRLTRQSAYALRARDPLFAAGWDAACELARQPLADALYEKVLDGVTDTITRDGEIVAERRRFDSRLAIAVLQRLDKRCDRAEESGSRHLAVLERWDEWIRLVGKGEEAQAVALLESANHCQNCQLTEGENPTAPESEDAEEAVEIVDHYDRCWRDDDGIWMTDFAPPDGYTGYESCEWEHQEKVIYKRECTADEIAILEADEAAAIAAEKSADLAIRDEWFQLLKEGVAEAKEEVDAEGKTGAKSRGKTKPAETPANPSS